MIAGTLPGARTISVSIFRNAELGHDAAAASFIVVAVVIGFIAVHLSNKLGVPS